MSKYYDHAIPL